ncbi:MAG: transposase [Clostridiales bacterium]|nr:transposase [Clostridiales bacterium]
MYIDYSVKDGKTYARLSNSVRNGGRVEKEDKGNLGRVLDKNLGIYRSRERGVFTFDLETGAYGGAPAGFVPTDVRKNRKEQLILDFGDVFFLDWYIRSAGLRPAIDAVGYGNMDTLYAMICYYAVCSMANSHAESWWEGSYARILYPKANLASQRVSDFLAAAGSEHAQRRFFQEYFGWLGRSGVQLTNILIDSTGLPNSIHFPLTAISNHNGEVSNEVRLIYAVHQKTGLPIFFRYCAGNVIDASTLTRCIEELKAQGVDVNFAILDAGHYTNGNVREFYDRGISFITRVKENCTLYKEIAASHLGALEAKENLVEYNGRYAYMKRVECEAEGHRAYAYVGLDIARKSSEAQKTFKCAAAKKMSTGQVYDAMAKQGVFMLVSSRRIAKEKVLPLYCTRQQIEQVFDIGKNYADMLPIRVHSEETFRGHLLLTFVAAVVIKKIQDSLAKTPITPISLFQDLRNQKCKVFEDRVITTEVFKKANDCYKHFKLDCPVVIQRQRFNL